MRGIHRWPVNSPHKAPVTWTLFPFDDVIMVLGLNGSGHKSYGTRVNPWTVLYDSTYTILFLTPQDELVNDDERVKSNFKHRHRASLALVTICWRRITWLGIQHMMWLGNCDASTWKVTSNPLDIGFVHGDIHGWSCKHNVYKIPRSPYRVRSRA